MTVTIKYSIECWIFGGEDNDQKRVLLLRVPARPGEHEAFWQPITGGIEDGETPGEACRREICEETGLQVDPAELVEVADGFEVVISPKLTIRKSIYAMDAPERRITISPHEHLDYRWVPPVQVADHLHWQSNRDTWQLVAYAHRLPVHAGTSDPGRDAG